MKLGNMNFKNMNLEKAVLPAAACTLMIFLLAMNHYRNQGEDLAARIAPEIVRFHVRANSDRKEDQALKLKVRDHLLTVMYEDLGPSASKNAIENYISEEKMNLEQISDQFISDQGYDYQTEITLSEQYFPEKTYGDMTFPNGTYEAVTVSIGSGRGHNWWCVLYPPLCFTDAATAEVPDSSKETLEHLLSPADYSELLHVKKPKVRLKLLEMLGFYE